MEKRYQFLDSKQQIVIKDYRTPTPWMNYLSNGTFHTMISQAGGGLAFYKSPQIWRINHYRLFLHELDFPHYDMRQRTHPDPRQKQ